VSLSPEVLVLTLAALLGGGKKDQEPLTFAL